MKRDMKAEKQTQESTAKVNPLTQSKSGKMIRDGASFEKTISVNAAGPAFEERKGELIVLPGQMNSGQPAEMKQQVKISKATVAKASGPLMEPIKPKKPCAAYVFFATAHSAMLRKEQN